MFASFATERRVDPKEIHDILRNDRRRRVLQYLKKRLEPVSLRNLSERIAELEAGEAPAPRDLRDSVYNSLHQTHLPKLDEKDIVEYDQDRKVVTLREHAKDVEIYMDVVTGFGVTWATYYRTLGVVGFFLIVLAEMDVAFFASIDSLLIPTLLLVVFALSSAYQVWSRRWLYMRALIGS